jgi:hypothetical protein
MAMRYGVTSEANPSVKLLTTGIEGSESGAGAGTGFTVDFLPAISDRQRRYSTIRWNAIYALDTDTDRRK